MKNWKKTATTVFWVLLAAMLLVRRIGQNVDDLNNDINVTSDQAGSPLYIFVFVIVPLMYVLLPVIRANFGKAKTYLFSAVGYAVWGFGGLALYAMGLLGDMPRGAFILLLIVVVGVVAWDLYLYRYYTSHKEE